MNAFLIQETGLILYSSSTRSTVYVALNEIWFAYSIHENDFFLTSKWICVHTKWNESANQIKFHEHLHFINLPNWFKKIGCMYNLFQAHLILYIATLYIHDNPISLDCNLGV